MKAQTHDDATRLARPIAESIGSWAMDVVFMKYSRAREMAAANSGKKCFLILMNVPTRFCVAQPMASDKASDVSEALSELILRVSECHRQLPFETIDAPDDSPAHSATERHQADCDQPSPGASADRQSALGILAVCRQNIKAWLQVEMDSKKTLSWVVILPGIVDRWNASELYTLSADDAAPMRLSPLSLVDLYLRDTDDAIAAANFVAAQIDAAHKKGYERFRTFDIGDRVRRVAPGADGVFEIKAIVGYSFFIAPLDAGESQRPVVDRPYRATELVKERRRSRPPK